ERQHTFAMHQHRPSAHRHTFGRAGTDLRRIGTDLRSIGTHLRSIGTGGPNIDSCAPTHMPALSIINRITPSFPAWLLIPCASALRNERSRRLRQRLAGRLSPRQRAITTGYMPPFGIDPEGVADNLPIFEVSGP